MLARAHTGSLIGIEAHPVIVEASHGKGLPGVVLVGLARGAVRESIVRVRAALSACGFSLGNHRVVINLLPAELPKEASALDLPLAMALLAASGHLPKSALRGRRFFGELSLGGRVEAVRGAVLVADLARREGDGEVFVPTPNADEAAIIPGVQSRGVDHLASLVAHLRDEISIAPTKPTYQAGAGKAPCLSEVRGQRAAKRAVTIAAAGGHNLLFVGPPGSGKTMLARRLPGLLPALNADECIEVTRIHSAAGALHRTSLLREPPFRAPHHTASDVALCGGGSNPRPGEITLAHRGVLFLDELPEFSRRALESLREPLEERAINIARAATSLRFPADVLFVAAMNPCPCGKFRPLGDKPQRISCLCNAEQIQRYRSRISGPLLDRIDLHVYVDALPFRDFSRGDDGETSEVIRGRVALARDEQYERLGDGRLNAGMDHEAIQRTVNLDDAMLTLIEGAIERYDLSARAIQRVLKVARTIADLNGEPEVNAEHLNEALGFRVIRPESDLDHRSNGESVVKSA